MIIVLLVLKQLFFSWIEIVHSSRGPGGGGAKSSKGGYVPVAYLGIMAPEANNELAKLASANGA